MIVPVVLSGGSGTRLWPLSRGVRPKQFLPLRTQSPGTDHTMLQETLLRLRGFAGVEAPIVVCNDAHRFLVAEQLRAVDITAAAILLEPVGRNTAPAIALAALRAAPFGDPLLLVLPADHVIEDVPKLHLALAAARVAAEAGHLVTFGVVPTRAETGYGYIRVSGAPPVQTVEAFVEKPSEALAREYLREGHLWNSGMFLFRASVFLGALETHAPDILAACTASMSGAREDLDFVRPDEQAFRDCPSDSIDYALMEKVSGARVVRLDAGWRDLGSWDALHEAARPDADRNVLRGDVVAYDTHDSYVYAESRLVATVGLSHHIVVETKDAVLVAHRDRAQDVKRLADRLEAEGRAEAALHREVYQPWGSYDRIDGGDRFQVKRLIVKPGGALSLQVHAHRAEHWVVVRGTARVTRGDETFLVHENESTFIPKGARHRLENPGPDPLHVIEVQSGAYLGEDDIVRFEDSYGRS